MEFLRAEKVHIITAAALIVGAIIVGWIIHHLIKKYLSSSAKLASDPSSKTKIKMTGRLINIFIYVIAMSLALYQFERVRAIGTWFLASAGIVGIVVGLGAQSTLSNIIAGVNLAFAQPFRLGDTVMVEEEYGYVEEIHLSNTFIRTWDNRRLIIPNHVLGEKPIINYSIVESHIAAKVELWLDYTTDISRARSIVVDTVKRNPNWNGKDEPTFAVTDMSENAIKARLVAEANSPREAWLLGSESREQIITRFQEEGIPLPRRRIEPLEKEQS